MSDVSISPKIYNDINELYKTYVDSIRNLGKIAKQLQDSRL